MDILKALHDERSKLQQQIDTVDAAIKILGGTNTENPKNTKRKLSAASRRKMSLSAKKRWAEKKKAK